VCCGSGLNGLLGTANRWMLSFAAVDMARLICEIVFSLQKNEEDVYQLRRFPALEAGGDQQVEQQKQSRPRNYFYFGSSRNLLVSVGLGGTLGERGVGLGNGWFAQPAGSCTTRLKLYRERKPLAWKMSVDSFCGGHYPRTFYVATAHGYL
jgi:hypothetical protein